MACSIWAATSTHENDFQSFLASRIMAGSFASLSAILGSNFIVDMFYLHQRGRAFAIYGTMPALGTLMGSTFGALIAGKQKWTISFWWTTPLLALAAIVFFLAIEETEREDIEQTDSRRSSRSYVESRIATFFPGNRVTVPRSTSQIVSCCIFLFMLTNKSSELEISRYIISKSL